jgi:hypothetical protein
MSGAIPQLPQYAFMAWCSVKAQGQLYLYLNEHSNELSASIKGGEFQASEEEFCSMELVKMKDFYNGTVISVLLY